MQDEKMTVAAYAVSDFLLIDPMTSNFLLCFVQTLRLLLIAVCV